MTNDLLEKRQPQSTDKEDEEKRERIMYEMVKTIWSRFVSNKKKYGHGQKFSHGFSQRIVGQCKKILAELSRYEASIADWVDAQFFCFYLHNQITPFINQVHSGKGNGAYKRYLFYMDRKGSELDVAVSVKRIKLSDKEQISLGQDLLSQARELHPGLDEVHIIQCFADQFPEPFIKWYCEQNICFEDHVQRVLEQFA